MGFHLPQDGDNFLASTELLTAAHADRSRRTVRLAGRTTYVSDAPISIDFDGHESVARSAAVDRSMVDWRSRVGAARHIGVGIDRSDYTKGIPERLEAVAALLEQNPSIHGHFTFVQVAVPSRGRVPEYGALERRIDTVVASINKKWGTSDWQPVVLEKRNLPPPEMMALHRLARFCLVSPLHDGMNLVAKEFVASRFDLDGVLLLSQFAGAARELQSAVKVNPFSTDSLYEGMVSALTMPAAERTQRMAAARAVVKNNNVFRWAGTLIEQMDAVLRSGTRKHQVANVA
jgi:trehalose-6-phosphate synthase